MPDQAADKTNGGGRPKMGAAKKVALWAAGIAGGAVITWLAAAAIQSGHDAITPPVQVNVEVDPRLVNGNLPNWVPYFYFLPIPDRAQLGAPPPDCRDRREWAWALGGADADESRAAVTLRGAREGEVSLDSIQVQVVSRTPVSGGLVAACPVGGASKPIHGLEVNLDSEKVSFVDDDKVVPARLTLAKGETEEFDVHATASGARVVKWRLVLEVVDGAARKRVVIDDHGKPFRTAGTIRPSTPMVIWQHHRWDAYQP
jgi:hypothetical protein